MLLSRSVIGRFHVCKRGLSTVNNSPISKFNPALLIPNINSVKHDNEQLDYLNGRLDNLSLSLRLLSIKPEILDKPDYIKPVIPIQNPNLISEIVNVNNNGLIIEKKDENNGKIIEDPGIIIEKLAHRMIRLRKRKMKRHRRKRRWVKNRSFYQGIIIRKNKTKEIEFRMRLMEKIKNAENYDPKAFLQDYLKDFRTPLIPRTYEGKRLPIWLIQQLMIEDKYKAQRKIDLTKTTLGKKDLINPGEGIDEYKKRIESAKKKY